MPVSVYDHVARELGLDAYTVKRHVAAGPSVTVDAVPETEERDYVVEVKGTPVGPEDLAPLVLANRLLDEERPDRETVAVLASPAATDGAREVAARLAVELVEIPPSLAPAGDRAGVTPLTTEKSWAVVAAVLTKQRFPSVRALAKHASVSTGWTYQVVQELEVRGALLRSGSGLRLDDEATILDAVPEQRPLAELETARVATGITDAQGLALALQAHLEGTPEPEAAPRAWVAATTAAAAYTGYLSQRDRFDVYCDAPAVLEDAFEGEEGGFELHVHEPDRPLSTGERFRNALPSVTREQAMLDTAGTGMAFRDLTLRLLAVMRG
jgi:DNA-binding transcriptional regulator YhcF (GntR family)